MFAVIQGAASAFFPTDNAMNDLSEGSELSAPPSYEELFDQTENIPATYNESAGSNQDAAYRYQNLYPCALPALSPAPVGSEEPNPPASELIEGESSTDDWEIIESAPTESAPTESMSLDPRVLSNTLLATYANYSESPRNTEYSFNYADMLIHVGNNALKQAPDDIIQSFKDLILSIGKKSGSDEKLQKDLKVIFLALLVKCIASKAKCGTAKGLPNKTLQRDLEDIISFAKTESGFLCPPLWINIHEPKEYGTEAINEEMFLQNFLTMALYSIPLPTLIDGFINEGSLDEESFNNRVVELVIPQIEDDSSNEALQASDPLIISQINALIEQLIND